MKTTNRTKIVESDDDNHDCVCLCDPTDISEGTCCCNHLGLRCNGKCRPDGYDRWLEARRASLVKVYIIIFAKDNPPKDT